MCSMRNGPVPGAHLTSFSGLNSILHHALLYILEQSVFTRLWKYRHLFSVNISGYDERKPSAAVCSRFQIVSQHECKWKGTEKLKCYSLYLFLLMCGFCVAIYSNKWYDQIDLKKSHLTIFIHFYLYSALIKHFTIQSKSSFTALRTSKT